MNKNGSVLIVDSCESFCKELCLALKHFGINAQYRLGARDARERIQENSIDLVVIYKSLPVEDGISLSSWVSTHYEDMAILMLCDPSESEVDLFTACIRKDQHDIKGVAQYISIYTRMAILDKRINKLDLGVSNMNVRSMMEQFCSDTIGRIVIGLIAGIFAYGIAQAEVMRENVSALQLSTKAIATQSEMTSREINAFISRLDKKK